MSKPTCITISTKLDLNVPDKIESQIPVEDMALAVSGLRYDKLRDFMNVLFNELERDAESYRLADKTKLARVLDLSISNIGLAAEDLNQAWEICKKYEEN